MVMENPEPLPIPSTYRPEFADEARKLALARAPDEAMALHFEIPLATLHEWLQSVPEFARAVRCGRKLGDIDVVDRFHQNCLGYAHEAVKIFRPVGTEDPVRAAYTQHHTPNTAAGKFWLLNRLPHEWRMKIEIEAQHSHADPKTLSRSELERRLSEFLGAGISAAEGHS